MLRSTPRHRKRRGVTLLEAIVAMVILASVGVATLQLRAATLAGAREAEQAARSDRVVQDLLDMAIAGLLAGAREEGGEDGPRTLAWEGVHLGSPYVVRRVEVRLPNPLYSEEAESEEKLAHAETIRCRRYEVEWGGARAVAIRPIRVRR